MNRYDLASPKPIKPPLLTDEEVMAYISTLDEPERAQALKIITHWSINDDKKNTLMQNHRPELEVILNQAAQPKNIFKRISRFFTVKKIAVKKRLRTFLLPRFERWLAKRGYYGHWRKKAIFKPLGDHDKEVALPMTQAPVDPMAPQRSIQPMIDRSIEAYEILEDLGPRGELGRNFFETIDHPETEAMLNKDKETDTKIDMGRKP